MADGSYAAEPPDGGAGDFELELELAARFAPLADSPGRVYAIRTRRLPAETVGTCADLRYLPSPIATRPPQDHALVSLIRASDGGVSGFQLEFCDIAGARTADATTKKTYVLRAHGVRGGLFHAGGGDGDVAYLTEGYSCKALALASLGIGPVYGGGGRNVLGCAVPPEAAVVIVPDRRPPDGPDALAHDADYKRAVDLLLIAGIRCR